MLECQECGSILIGRQKFFCSIECRNRANGRKTGGWNKKPMPWVICRNCAIMFQVHPSRKAKTNVQACSRKCLGEIQSRERKGKTRPELGIQTYRRARKSACERCGTTERLLVHHKDEDRYNNELSNLETLCRRCHQIHHHCERNLPNARAERTSQERP